MMSDKHIRDVETLLAEVEKGFRPEYLFFWGHRPRADGQIGKQCLSQWWMAPFTVGGIVYATAEHYMMAEKARLFGDDVARERVLAAPRPEDAKKLGRTVAGFDEAVWIAHRFAIIVRGNEAKFGQNAELGSYLSSTRGHILVEASPEDRIWGIGLAEKDADAGNPKKWRGLNLLGFALMEVRERLRGLP